jgi:hypothetical protein
MNLESNLTIDRMNLCSFKEDMMNNMDIQIGPSFIGIPLFNALLKQNSKMRGQACVCHQNEHTSTNWGF